MFSGYSQTTEMPMNRKRTLTRICASVTLVSLLLFTVLWTGCTTAKDYPGPIHGLAFNGTIKSIDLTEHRLTVAPLKAGEPTVFRWNDSTKFWKKGVPIKAESLEPAWPVRVHYHTASGQATAHHVYVELSYPVVH